MGNPASRSGKRRPFSLPLAILGLAFLASCGQVSSVGTGPSSADSAIPLRTQGEGIAIAPCGLLWSETEDVTLRGLYRTSGQEAYIDVIHVLSDTLPCWARFFLDRDLGLGPVSWDEPRYVEVAGRPSVGRWSSPNLWDLGGVRGAVLSFDIGKARQACQQAVAARATELQGLDWAMLAAPSYVTGTAGFRPAAADLARVRVQMVGTDDQRPLLWMSTEGPDLPAVRSLVRRWVAVDCLYDLEQQRVLELVATIRGEVQE